MNTLLSLSKLATEEAESHLDGDTKLAYVIAIGMDGTKKVIFANIISDISHECDPQDFFEVGYRPIPDEEIDSKEIPHPQKVLAFLQLCRQPGGGLGPCGPNPIIA